LEGLREGGRELSGRGETGQEGFFLSFIFCLQVDGFQFFDGREKADARKGGLRAVVVGVTRKVNFIVDCYTIGSSNLV